MKRNLTVKQQPLFLLLEGIDGSGKTTAASGLQHELTYRGINCAVFSEPTRGRYGTEIRHLLSRPEPDNAKLLELFILDRLEDIALHIQPALARNAIVILDRYYYSNAVYQAQSCKEAEEIAARNRAHGMPEPDRIYYFSLTPEEAMRRINARSAYAGKECFDNPERLRAVSRRYAHLLPHDTVHVDATADPADIVELILADIAAYQQQEESSA